MIHVTMYATISSLCARRALGNRMTHRNGVLFVHQAATRNGAPIVLLHILRWLRSNGKRPFSILLSQSGDLINEFGATANVWVAESGHWHPSRFRSRAMHAFGLERFCLRIERADLRKFARKCPPALIYLNAVSGANFRLIEMLDLDLPILTHVHELGLLLRAQTGAALPRILSKTRHFIACSNAVGENLIQNHGIRADRVDVVHESISVADVCADRPREDILRELGFPPDSLLVVGCGNAAWNKGTDAFVQMARVICRQDERVRFAWVGGGSSWGGWEISQFEHDIRMIGLSDRIRFTGLVAQPANYIAAADVFVLSSREDSFPLVCLEAAALGKPIICFADAGGMPEFVEEDAGFIVPYLDVEMMAQRVLELLNCPMRRKAFGANAKRKVGERHDVSKAAARIAEIIEGTIAAT